VRLLLVRQILSRRRSSNSLPSELQCHKNICQEYIRRIANTVGFRLGNLGSLGNLALDSLDSLAQCTLSLCSLSP